MKATIPVPTPSKAAALPSLWASLATSAHRPLVLDELSFLLTLPSLDKVLHGQSVQSEYINLPASIEEQPDRDRIARP